MAASSETPEPQSARRKMQQIGRKPEKDGGIADTIMSFMASENTNGMSAFYLTHIAQDVPALTSSTPVHVLEVGHGSGHMLAGACKLNDNEASTFRGVEWSEAMHQLAKTVVTDSRAALSLSDANETLPFEKETFDLVVSAHCVYFWDDLATSIREQARLIKPGGVLCIIMAEATKAWDRDIYKNVDVEVILDALKSNGLEVHNKRIADENATYEEDEGGEEGGDGEELMRFFAEAVPEELSAAKYDMYISARKPAQ